MRSSAGEGQVEGNDPARVNELGTSRVRLDRLSRAVASLPLPPVDVRRVVVVRAERFGVGYAEAVLVLASAGLLGVPEPEFRRSGVPGIDPARVRSALDRDGVAVFDVPLAVTGNRASRRAAGRKQRGEM